LRGPDIEIISPTAMLVEPNLNSTRAVTHVDTPKAVPPTRAIVVN